MVTVDTNLIPTEVQAEIIQGVVNKSVALSLGNVQPMPTGKEAVPILGSLPSAGWTAVGGRKPTTTMSWTSTMLQAEEVAATIDVPRAYIDDAGFPLWDSISPRMVEALALVIDQAILYGTNAPASFPVGGVLGFSTAVAALPAAPQNDIVGLFNAMLNTVEATGLEPTGFASDIVIKGKLRGARMTTGEPLYVPGVASPGAIDMIYGLPAFWSRGAAFVVASASSIVGDWSSLRIGVRQDVTVDQSDEAVLADSTGKVLVSAFQDDKRIMRVFMRLGCAIGKPVTQKAPAGANPWAHVTTTITGPLGFDVETPDPQGEPPKVEHPYGGDEVAKQEAEMGHVTHATRAKQAHAKTASD